MLNELLEGLDRYNVEIREKESELNKAVLDRIRQFYEENREELEEADRLLEVMIKSEPPIIELMPDDLESARNARPGTLLQQLSPETQAYIEKGTLLVDKLNQRISGLGINYVGSACTALGLQALLESDPKSFTIEPAFFIMPDAQTGIHQLEDRGYEILFRAVGEILNGLISNSCYNATYWGGGGDYVSRFFGHGKWKHLGLEGKRKNPYGVVHVKHDINSPERPFQDASEDVAILKTLGSIVSGDTYMKFWRKMTDALKIGGLVISDYEIPVEFRGSYRQLTNLGDSGRDFLEFKSVTQRITHYFPDRIYFFQKVA